MSNQKLIIKLIESQRLMSWSGIGLMVIGLLLTPILVGLPILIFGWLIVVIAHWRKWFQILPPSIQTRIKAQIKQEYTTLAPTIIGFRSILVNILHISGLVFIFIIGILIWIYLHQSAKNPPSSRVNINQIFNHHVADLPEIPDNQATCEAIGGVWKKIGIGPKEQCNLKTSDGGYSCIDSKACESLCIADLTTEQLNLLKTAKNPISTKGKCAQWRIIVGCQPIVIEGQVSELFCLD